MRIKAKILFPMITLTLLVAAAILISNIVSFSSFVDKTTIDRLNSATQTAEYSLDALKAEAAAVSAGISKDLEIVRAIEDPEHIELIARADEMLDQSGMEFCTITDANGNVIARTHAPPNEGDSVINQTNVQSALNGQALTVIEEGTVVRLSVRSGSPVYNDQGSLIGVISAGARLDTDTFVDRIKSIMGCEVTIVLGDERVATTVIQEDGTRAVGTKADAHIVETVLAGSTYSGRVDLLGRLAEANYVPIEGPDNSPIGMLFLGQYIDEELGIIASFVHSGLIFTFVILAAIICIILFITSRIVTPIRAMTAAASSLAAGDTELHIQVKTKDEMGTLARAFRTMVENTRSQVDAIERIADGDLSVSLPLRSDEDVMNRSIEKLITTLRTQAAAIKEEHERIKLMLDATPLASRLWDRDYHLIECNEAAVKLFGLNSKQEYISRYFELAPELQSDGQTTREKATLVVRKAFELGTYVSDFMYKLPDGSLLPAELTAVRVPYGDDFVVASYSRDLREHKKMMAEIEQRDHLLQTALTDARNANEAKSNFLAQMSHEIRTPLNVVVGLSELMLNNDELTVESESKLENIHTSGMTILSIVNDILDISKIESGKFEIFPVQYDTPSLINDVVTLNIVRIQEKAIVFKLVVDENLPGLLLGDDLRVKQIFNNLLSNAFKYTHKGSVEWNISFEREGGSIWLVSSIKDTGIGIKPGDVDKLFSDYNQVDAKTNRKVEGTGLGLAITKRLVDMMDGTITVESTYGKGSIFSVRLRQAFVSELPIGKVIAENLMGLHYTLSKRANNTKIARVDLSYANVLIVDDIATNLDVVSGMMKPYGMSIDIATSGQQAIDMVHAGVPRYNAIFMDHMMPGMDGVEATRIIREEIDTDYARNIPIIALTANAIVGNEAMFLSKGFQAFISKPIDMMKLDAVLRQWVRDKDFERALHKSRASGAAPNHTGAQNAVQLFSGFAVEGVDIQRAQERFGGDDIVLVDVLRSFVRNTRPLLNTLQEYLDEKNMPDYAIVVHGIKGSSYCISAQNIGKAAEILEEAAKDGRLDEVSERHPEFERQAHALLDELDTALGQIDISANKPVETEPDPALLEELRTACRAFDMDRVDAAMSRLELFQYEKGEELIAWLRERVDRMAFEEVFEGDWPSS